jgi:hypothetical protein
MKAFTRSSRLRSEIEISVLRQSFELNIILDSIYLVHAFMRTSLPLRKKAEAKIASYI